MNDIAYDFGFCMDEGAVGIGRWEFLSLPQLTYWLGLQVVGPNVISLSI